MQAARSDRWPVRNLKKCVLELGGSDAFVVFDDADLAEAVDAAISGRFLNAGQSCIAAKRILVQESVAAEFEERLVERARGLRMGDPTREDTDLGPMARFDLRDELVGLVKASVANGALVAAGGGTRDQGAYLEPTVLLGVTPGMPVFDQETFGPVAAVHRFATDDDAIAVANAGEYGLSLSLWTPDRERGLRAAAGIETGMAYLNTYTASDPRMPFGGVKNSGFGRELGELGIYEFANARTFAVN